MERVVELSGSRIFKLFIACLCASATCQLAFGATLKEYSGSTGSDSGAIAEAGEDIFVLLEFAATCDAWIFRNRPQ